MNIWLLLLTVLNIILLVGLSFSLFMRLKEKKEDQRLTKGLQLLQNKISILEDLSDRTDEQVHKLVHLIDKKASEVRTHLNTANEQMELMKTSLSQASERIQMLNEPISENQIHQRKKTNAYVQAAKMAHQGYTIEQISTQIDLSPAEIEMITKVNKDNLQFAENNLPAWIQDNATDTKKHEHNDLQIFTEALNLQNQKLNSSVSSTVSASAFDPLAQDLVAQNTLRAEFNKTVKTVNGNNLEKSIRPMEFTKITSHRL